MAFLQQHKVCLINISNVKNILLKNLENDSVQNKLNLRVLLSVARVMKYNMQFLKTRYRLGEAFIKASQFADQGNSVDALKNIE